MQLPNCNLLMSIVSILLADLASGQALLSTDALTNMFNIRNDPEIREHLDTGIFTNMVFKKITSPYSLV